LPYPAARPFPSRRWQRPGYGDHSNEQETSMKSIILWLAGVPIGVIILLKVFGVF
jgi:hypothetical protein